MFWILSIKELWKFVFFHYKSAYVVLSVLPLGKVYYLAPYRKSLVIPSLIDCGEGPWDLSFLIFLIIKFFIKRVRSLSSGWCLRGLSKSFYMCLLSSWCLVEIRLNPWTSIRREIVLVAGVKLSIPSIQKLFCVTNRNSSSCIFRIFQKVFAYLVVKWLPLSFRCLLRAREKELWTATVGALRPGRCSSCVPGGWHQNFRAQITEKHR